MNERSGHNRGAGRRHLSSAGNPFKSGSAALPDADRTDPGATALSAEELARLSDTLVDDTLPGSTELAEVQHVERTEIYNANALPAARAPQFKLVALAGPRAGAEFPLSDGEVTIGRAADADISIPDVSVSRRHVSVALRGDGLVVTDLGSGNGTLVNDARVQTSPVAHGDEIQLGDTVLQVVDLDGPPLGRGRARKRPADIAVAETVAPSAPARTEVVPPRAAPRPAAPRRTQAGPSKRARLYAVAAIVLVLLGALVVIAKARQSGGGVPVIGRQNAPAEFERLFEEGLAHARADEWQKAVEKFEEAAQLGESDRLTRNLEGARVQAVHQKRLVDAQQRLEAAEFAAALELAQAIPETAAVYPKARELVRRIDGSADETVQRARALVGQGSLSEARALVGKVLSFRPEHSGAVALSAEIDRQVAAAAARNAPKPTPVVAAAPPPKPAAPKPAPAQKTSDSTGPAIDAYLAGDLARAIVLAEQAGDASGAKLLDKLRAFESNYRVGMERAQAQRASDAVKHLSAAWKADREMSQGRTSKPGGEVARQLANMEYLLGIDSRGDEQLPRAAAHYRAALQVQPDHELSKKQLTRVETRAREIYTEAYLIKATEPARARRMFKLVATTLPSSDEYQDKAQRWFERLDGKAED